VSPYRVELMLWGVALPLALMAGIRARSGGFRGDASPAAPTTIPAVRRIGAESLAAASARIVERDPFRLDRRPSSVPYAPMMLEGAAPPVARPPKPALVVTGIVGGPPWEALVDGIPGRPASVVVRRGDAFGDSTSRLIVKRIGPDTVVIAGMDTTWTLTVRKAWQ
jgi:hypothetical protein